MHSSQVPSSQQVQRKLLGIWKSPTFDSQACTEQPTDHAAWCPPLCMGSQMLMDCCLMCSVLLMLAGIKLLTYDSRFLLPWKQSELCETSQLPSLTVSIWQYRFSEQRLEPLHLTLRKDSLCASWARHPAVTWQQGDSFWCQLSLWGSQTSGREGLKLSWLRLGLVTASMMTSWPLWKSILSPQAGKVGHLCLIYPQALTQTNKVPAPGSSWKMDNTTQMLMSHKERQQKMWGRYRYLTLSFQI